jgi:type VI secretion system secreted protein VgrG
MEEEGICYFFKHTASGHQMVLANSPTAHPAVPGPAKIRYMKTINYKSDEDGVGAWEKVQEVRPGKYTLWDHCFELPHQHLEANKPVKDSVPVGTVTHKLKVGGNDKLEVYDWPGAYAQRFDGIDKGGGERPADLQKIYEDNARTVAIRMQQDSESQSFAIRGASNCRHFVPGHKFTLERHYNADGEYVLTEVSHSANQEVIYRSTLEAVAGFSYENHFKCIPAGVHYAPPRLTAKPVVHGTQTAVVVGPPGEEIYPDKYGRVKIQFHWDRQGKNDADSSCWCRVAQPWAGQNWGMISLPRIGQEVVIDFLEGDPDHPIIIGSVYNADQMPAYKLPDRKTAAYWKSRTTPKGTPSNYNEIRMDDTKGKEQVYVQAEFDSDYRVKHDRREVVGGGYHMIVGGDHREKIGANHHVQIAGAEVEKIGKNLSIDIGASHVERTAGGISLDVGSNYILKTGAGMHLNVGGSHEEKVGSKLACDVGQEIHLKAGMKVIIEAGAQISLKGPGGFVDIGPAGVTIQGTMVLINSGGSAGSGSGASPMAPVAPANPENPDEADDGTKFTKLA